ncbi:MAG: hypothetical protein M3Z36_03015 [Acidobacteriota bacterium]|nr:hypothetical protein [Acidobacteriota bacterium]
MSDFPRDERSLLKQAFSATPECPPLEHLQTYAETGPPPGSHAAACSHCQAEIGLLREFLKSEPGREESLPVQWIAAELKRREQPIAPRRRFSFGSWVPDLRSMSLVAASLLVMVGAGFYLQHQRDPGLSGVYRSGDEIMRSGLVAATPAGEIAQAPAEFTWEAAPGATRYEVTVMEVDHNEIWKTESTQTRAEPTSRIRNILAPGRSFLWQVDAFDGGGKKIASSNLQKFHISPRSSGR